MALAQRVSPGGGRWDKKNDTTHSSLNQASSIRPPWKSIRRRRLIQGLVVALFLFLFIHNIPTDVPSVGRRYNANFGSMASGHSKAHFDTPLEELSKNHDQVSDDPYENPILFSRLSDTLRGAMTQPRENNVLFGITSHSSAQKLIPIICSMAQYNRSNIHVALLGKQDMTVQEMMKINGIDADTCHVSWHDATPDHAAQSPPSRLYTSVKTALPYFNSALQPQVMLVDDLTKSDLQMMDIVTDTMNMLGVPLLTLPSYGLGSMDWIAALDGQSLRQFGNTQIDIIVQAYSESAGSLIRLLHSLERAHYHGLTVPRLIVELPPKVDPFVTRFLSGFRWPPGSTAAYNKLTVRRRIDLKQISPAQASLRMLESFYPNSPSNSHLLMLSPNAELAPDYMYYLMFTLLEYKYSQRSTDWSNQLMGISLEYPLSRPDGSGSFLDTAAQVTGSIIQSQTPNSNAALYFGDKWVEFHDFLSKRLAADPKLTHDKSADVTVSKATPQWLAQASEMMIAQGYAMLYPAFNREEGTNIVVVHTDLYHPPEEFVETEATEHTAMSGDEYVKSVAMKDATYSESDRTKEKTELTVDASSRSILTLLGIRPTKSGAAGLPGLATLPVFSPSGEIWDREQIVQASLNFADRFSVRVGGCSSLDDRDGSQLGSVNYLFCDPG